LDIRLLDRNHRAEVTGLFKAVFTVSAGSEEGNLLAGLVAELAANIDNEQIICVGAYDYEALIAAIFFTRLDCHESVMIHMLAPVAVSTGHQGKGVGQGLIKHGLDLLKNRAVDAVITYGDPAFYSQVGFHSITESQLKAPQTLSMPQGWLGQSLTSAPIPTIEQRPTCVPAFNDPAYW
jgi:predicted N-acetyltransferase YhbS